MAGRAKETEHSGAKHGNGAYWGRKVDAKAESNKVRRLRDRITVVSEGDHVCVYTYVITDEYGNDTGFRLCDICLEVE